MSTTKSGKSIRETSTGSLLSIFCIIAYKAGVEYIYSKPILTKIVRMNRKLNYSRNKTGFASDKIPPVLRGKNAFQPNQMTR